MAGEMVHVEIPTSDTASAKEFWGSLFGWRFHPYEEAVDYHLTQIDERQGVAISGMEEDAKGPRIYFDVDDINAGAARVKELGGDAADPLAVPGMGWFVTCTDPSGNQFGLWQTDPSAEMPTDAQG